jgi:hypothetical protein
LVGVTRGGQLLFGRAATWMDGVEPNANGVFHSHCNGNSYIYWPPAAECTALKGSSPSF